MEGRATRPLSFMPVACAADDLDESGLIDDETELNLLVTNVCFYAHREHAIEAAPTHSPAVR